MAELTSTKAFVAHTGDQHNGPSHAPSHWDHLPVPNGGTVGSMPTEVLRRLCHRMGIEGAHSVGRATLLDSFALKLRQVGNAASDKAIMEFLSKYKD